MKRILIAVLLTGLLMTVGAMQGVEYKTIVVGTLSGAAADTTLLGRWLYGYDHAAIEIRGDTLVDTVAIVKIQLDLGGLGGEYNRTIGVATAGDTLILTTEAVIEDSVDWCSPHWGSSPLARLRVIGQHADYRVDACTLRLYRWKND